MKISPVMPPAAVKRANYSRPAGKTSRLSGAVLAALLLAAGSIAGAQPAPAAPPIACAACHLSSAQAPGWTHVMAWEGSRHAAAGVACHDCHRGDPTAASKAVAHVGMLKALHPNSPVRRAALPRTCGQCHTGQLEAFRESQHSALLQTLEARRGDTRRVPTCATCHGSVGLRPSAPQVERECRSCHGAGGQRPRFERIGQIADIVEDARRIRVQLAAADRLVAAIEVSASRRSAEASAAEARRTFDAALGRLHRFDLPRTAGDLEVAARHVAEAYAQILMLR